MLNASLKYFNKKANFIKYDPETKKVYNLSRMKVDADLMKRLKVLPGRTPEKLKERMDTFNEMIDAMKEKFSYRMQMVDIESNFPPQPNLILF